MKRRTALVGAVLTLALTGGALLVTQGGAGIRTPEAGLPDVLTAVAGESRTLLPDGRWLIVGGQVGANALRRALLWDPRGGQPIDLESGRRRARAWHTATVLPDGTVLIVGGLADGRHLVGSVEVFDPVTQNFHDLPGEALLPRALHSATLTTEKRVLLAGGLGPDGEVVDAVESWDWRTQTAEVLPARLGTDRYGHAATLLPNGTVLLWGGFDQRGNGLANGELFDPESQQVTSVDLGPPLTDTGPPRVEASVPADGGATSSVDTVIAVRFSKPLAVETLTSGTVVLTGPRGIATARVVPAEGGMLLFVTPDVRLEPGATYTLTLSGPVDPNGLSLPATTIRFRTEGPGGEGAGARDAVPGFPLGAEEAESGGGHGEGTPPPDRLWVPTEAALRGDWRIGLPPSPWQSLAPLQGRAGVTALSGQVLRLDGLPLAKVTLQIGRAKTKTDHTGRFLLDKIDAGTQTLIVDARPAGHGSVTYGFFMLAVTLEPAKTTVLPYTIFMPVIDTEHTTRFPSPTTNDVVATTPLIPGLEVRIPAGVILRDVDGTPVTAITITPIPLDRGPFPGPDDVRFPLFFTIQPGGARVEVVRGKADAGISIVYPNYTHVPAGSALDYWSYDASGRGWFTYGLGRVGAGGRQIFPDEGVVTQVLTCVSLQDPASGGGAGGGAGGGCSGGCCEGPGGDGDGPGGAGGGPGGGGGSSGGGGGGSRGGGGGSRGGGFGTGGYCGSVASDYDGEPVHLNTGLFILRETDLYLPDVIPIVLTRTHRPNDSLSRPFGIGATHPYEMFLIGPNELGTGSPCLSVELVLPDGGRIRYDRQSGTNCVTAVMSPHTSTPSRYYGSSLTAIPGGNTVAQWNLTLKDGTVFVFKVRSEPGIHTVLLDAVRDRFGNQLTITREPTNRATFLDRIMTITSSNGRWVQFAYEPGYNRVSQLTDNLGRTVQYTYDLGRLKTVTDVEQGTTTYNYDGTSSRVYTIITPRENDECHPPSCTPAPLLTNEYLPDGKVMRQTLAGGGVYQFAYTFGPTGKVIETNITYPSFSLPTRRVTFNDDGFIVTDTRGLNTPVARMVTYGRSPASNPGSNLVWSVTEPLTDTPTCRKTTFEYDAAGNPFSRSRLAGPCGGSFATLAETIFTYGPFNQLATISDALTNRTTHFNYDPTDPLGRLTGITDATARTFPVTISTAGQLTSVSDPLAHATTFDYEGGDLVAVTDATNNTTRRFVDGAGRVRSITDPLGRVTRYDYDKFNHLTQVTDPLGGVISFQYDPNGNLETVTDSRHSPPTITQYHYDPLNRLDWRRDPLYPVHPQESFAYDLLGNLVSHTDRRTPAIVTDFRYDGLNRRMCAGFGRNAGTGDCQTPANYQSAVQYTYDKGNRLQQLLDIDNGTVTRGYDDLDNVISETGSLGSLVLYTYEPGSSRRTSMSIGSQSYGYCYDDADRLTKITQGTSCSATPLVTIELEPPTGRRQKVTSLTAPSGISTTYGYDNASRISSIQYKKADGSLLGSLTYTYDAAGNRNGVLGEWARTGLPAAVSGNLYDAADQLKQWGSNTGFTYDGNGNLLGDGSKSYMWNARNQLTDITGATTANFTYDPLGRRSVKTIAGVPTGFVYDGLNPVQELTSASTTSLVTGLGIDEYFLRNVVAGSTTTRRSLLTDALGSTTALTDDSGGLQTQYQYEPFGEMSLVPGSPGDSNPFQFTGRENDGTGLDYYRARYYAPTWGRFISEDPLELVGANPNPYAYADGNPTNYTDPLGLEIICGRLPPWFTRLPPSQRYIPPRTPVQLKPPAPTPRVCPPPPPPELIPPPEQTWWGKALQDLSDLLGSHTCTSRRRPYPPWEL